MISINLSKDFICCNTFQSYHVSAYGDKGSFKKNAELCECAGGKGMFFNVSWILCKQKITCVRLISAVDRLTWFLCQRVYVSLTLLHWGGQDDVGSLLSIEFFLPPSEHMPPCTASKSTGFKSPYSPDATSITVKKKKKDYREDLENSKYIYKPFRQIIELKVIEDTLCGQKFAATVTTDHHINMCFLNLLF